MKLKSLLAAIIAMGMTISTAQAADYVVDAAGAHASINFRIKHLGYSWLTGRFNTFSGTFSFDEKNPAASKVSIEIDTASVSTNHAKRDKHIRSADFFDVKKFPKATFVSTGMETTGATTGIIKGNLTFHGVTKPITIKGEYIGGGDDPWGGFRQGFAGTTEITLTQFGIKNILGAASEKIELSLNLEGVRKK